MLAYVEALEPYSHFLISTALGMLVGLQREWADTHAAGIRTFTFISLLGTACALIAETFGHWFVGLGLGAAVLFAVLAHFQTMQSEGGMQRSMVTAVTLLLMYLVGVLVQSGFILPAAGLACLVAMILHIKIELHAFADRVTSQELHSVMQFLLITLVILPLMPDRSFGPQGVLNLHNIWLMVVLILGIGLVGYVVHKFSGTRTGVIGGGVIGGLISSTATTFTYARLSSRTEGAHFFHALVILIAWLIVYFRVFLEVFIVSPKVPVLMPLIVMSILTVGLIAWTWRSKLPASEEVTIKSNPIDLKTAVFFAVFYSLLVGVFAYLREEMSSFALYAVTFVAGILDIDAITLTTARMVDKGLMDSQKAVAYVFIALIANTMFKGVLCLFIAGSPLFRIIFIPWLVSILFQFIIVFWYW